MKKEAYANSLAKVEEKKQIIKGNTITKSISPIKKKVGKLLPVKRK